MLRATVRLVLFYLLVLAVACVIVQRHYSLAPVAGEVIASVWKDGALRARFILPQRGSKDARLDAALEESGGELVYESIVAEGPVLKRPDLALALSFVAGRDGLRATLDGRTAYVTPDDLLLRQAYDRGVTLPSLGLAVGLDTRVLEGLLADRLKVEAGSALGRANLSRIRVERHAPSDRPRMSPAGLTRDSVQSAASAAARYLARSTGPEGRFRYAVGAPANEDLPGYDWARHAGATFFLAQAAGATRDPAVADAARRAAALLRGPALGSCGGTPCIADEPIAYLGGSALALLAFVEIVERGIDDSYRPVVADLARFLRSQQRLDGEFMHEYDRANKRSRDVQYLYYSSEATLALARAYALTGDRADRDAAVRGLRNLVGVAWSFFGDHYYFGEEHWTCQAMAALWTEAPDRNALDFCLRWLAFNGAMQQREGDSAFDADGAIGVSPIVTPRLTPVASRCEAAVATLGVAKRAGIERRQLLLLDDQLRRALSLLLRQQLDPGPRHLFKDPEAVRGAIPGSEVDWELRIDYTQHAGSAMLRWLETASG